MTCSSPVGCSISNSAHAQFISKMAAVQGGIVDTVDKKDIKAEPSEDGIGNNNNNGNDNRMLSPSPSSSSSSGNSNSNSTAAAATVDQQTLVAVLQFLKKNKLNDSVEILRREAGLPEDSLDIKGSDPGAGGAAGSGNLEAVDAATLLNRVSVSASAAAQPQVKGTLTSTLDVFLPTELQHFYSYISTDEPLKACNYRSNLVQLI